MALFYIPDAALQAALPEEEARHCFQVLRLKAGDTIEVVDGQGTYYKAKLLPPQGKLFPIEILESFPNFEQRNFYIHLAIAPTKNIERIEWMLEKCVEIGIDELSFVLCERSERKILKMERLEKIAIQAMKQSRKAQKPRLNALQSFSQFVEKAPKGQNFIAHLAEDKRKPLAQAIHLQGKYCILIGPEGDFSPKEIQNALNQDFLAVSLGESRLRTESAGLVACHIVHVVHQLA